MASDLLQGIYVLQIARLSSAGYPMGQLLTPDAPVAGTVYSPYVVPAPVEYQPATPTWVEFESYARGKPRGRATPGISSLGTGTLVLAEDDDTFEALIKGKAVDTTTATAARIASGNFASNAPRRFLVGLTPIALAYDSVIQYKTIWKWGYFSWSETGMNSGEGRNPNNRSYVFHPTLSPRTPFGQLFSAATVDPDNDTDSEYKMRDTAPFALTTYVDDGSGTSILQAYTPDYSEVAGAHNIFFKNGADNKAGVASLSGKTWTITASTSGHIWVLLTPSTEILSLAA